MEELQIQETKSEQPLPAVGTTSDFQTDVRPTRTRFNLSSTKNHQEYLAAKWKHRFQRRRSGTRSGDETVHDQPRLWFCGCTSDMNDTNSLIAAFSRPQEEEVEILFRGVRRGKDSPSNPYNSSIAFADNGMEDYEYADDISGIVSRDVSTFTSCSKTLVANNRGTSKKRDLLQPIYDRMGLHSKKEKKGLRDAFADLLFMMR